EREAASAAVATLRLTPVMQELAASPEPETSSDVFVGVYWQRYGWKSDASAAAVVEADYVGSRDVPRFVYVKEPAPDREPELDRLLERIRAQDRVPARTFATPGELAELLLDDLAGLMAERFYGGGTPVHDLPEGTVSLLFADIDGSTPIVRLLGAAYPEGVLDPFRAVVTDAVHAEGGAVVDFEGDGAFCAFPAADGAAEAAVEIQRALASRTWPEGVAVRARIGIHTGDALRTPDGYAGIEVHRAARIGAAANGGQILVSRATADLLDGKDGLTPVELGSFALKGLDRAEPLLHLLAAGLESGLPLPRSRGEGARPLLETIQEHLAADRVLLVLDNFEQVLEAASVVADLLEGSPGTDVLVTSRAPLRVRGEWEHPVDPLATPAAVELFLDRARATRPGWEPSADELEAVG